MSEEQATRELLVGLLRDFHRRAWVSGTGGGICGPAEGGGLLIAPTGVHKERVQPDEFFTVDPADGRVLGRRTGPTSGRASATDLLPLHRARGSSSVVHSHALLRCSSAICAEGGDHVAIRDLEMLKGIRGVTNTDVHLVPVIRNTPREPELVGELEGAGRSAVRRRLTRSSCATMAPTSGATT